MIFKLLFHLFLLFIFIERIKSTFSNSKNYKKYKTTIESLLCLTMIILYISILILAFTSIYSHSFQLDTLIFVVGLIVWFLGVWYRRSSIRSLGKNWSIYRTASHLKRVMNLGTYDYARHPYYAATILELTGYCLLFHSSGALLLTFCIYLPLTLLRIAQEEKMLIERFPVEYMKYREETPLIFNIRKFIKDSRLANHFKQIIWVTKKYGWKQLTRIVFMNRAVKRYFRNYIISQCIAALSKVGFLDQMLDENIVDIAAFSKKNDVNFRILKLICDYLYVIRILYKKGFIYSFTNYGQSLFDSSRGVFDFIYAYAPIFENLDAMLKNEKSYGKEILRRGEFVGRASAELAELFPFPVARTLLSKHHLSSILDLGSGSGDFLIGFCKEQDVRGCGIDLSPEAVAYANKKALEHQVDDRVRFIVGDIMNLKKHVKLQDKVDVITCMFVLHEFLSISEQSVIDIFSSVKEAFPDKYILICELTRCSLDHLYHSPSGVTEHHLFHYLSNQGLATARGWKKIFKKAGLRVVDEGRLDLAEQSIFLLQSDGTSL